MKATLLIQCYFWHIQPNFLFFLSCHSVYHVFVTIEHASKERGIGDFSEIHLTFPALENTIEYLIISFLSLHVYHDEAIVAYAIYWFRLHIYALLCPCLCVCMCAGRLLCIRRGNQ